MHLKKKFKNFLAILLVSFLSVNNISLSHATELILDSDTVQLQNNISEKATIKNKEIKVEDLNVDNEGYTILNVTDFGADPSGRKDSAAAVQKAMEYAKENSISPVKINFPKGEYHFYADYAPEREWYVSNTVGVYPEHKMKRVGILVEDMNDVIVDGQGSLFIYHGSLTTFASIRSKNVIFRNFETDFYSPRTVDVTVEEAVKDGSEKYAIAYIPESYNYEIAGNTIKWTGDKGSEGAEPFWTGSGNIGYQQVFEHQTGLTKRVTWSNINPYPLLFNEGISSITDIGNNRVKIVYNEANNVPDAGLCYQMREFARVVPGIFIWESEDTVAQNIDVHYLHGFGVVGQLSRNITLDNMKFVTRPGTGRTTAGFADFVQMSSVAGKITIQNCEFTDPHDDPINIHGTYLSINKVLAPNKFELKYMHGDTGGFPQFYKGDEVEFINKSDFVPIENSLAHVIDVDNFPDGDRNTIILTVDKDIQGAEGGHKFAVENVTYTPEVVIRNNVFKEVPTRGILVTTRRPVLIEDNYFDGTGMASIFISCDATSWYESGPVTDVTIKNNVFDRPLNESVLIEPTNPINGPQKIHKNISIENNIFNIEKEVGQNIWGNPVSLILSAKSVDGLKFNNNTINRYNPDVKLQIKDQSGTMQAGTIKKLEIEKEGKLHSGTMFDFTACSDVEMHNNTYDAGFNQRVNLKYGSGDDPSSIITEDDFSIIGDNLKFGEDNQQPAVSDIIFVSSNENVATVDKLGNVVAKSAGTTDIWAYTVSGKRTYESNKIQITVEGNASLVSPSNITVNSDTEIVNIGDILNLSTVIEPSNATGEIVWTVKDFATKAETDKATISTDGVLSTTKEGVVEVIATSVADSNIYGSKVITIDNPNRTAIKADNWTIENEVKDGENDSWHITDDGKLVINALEGGSYGGSKAAKNMFVTDITANDKNNFSVTVKLNNKTSGSYEEAGLAFLKDQDNYVYLQRKQAGNSPVIAVVTEEAANPNEDGTVSDIENQEIYFKLTKTGDEYEGFYSIDGSNWISVRKITNASLGTDFKVGVIAAVSSDKTPYTFEQFSIDNTNIPFGTTGGEKPTVTNPQITGELKVLGTINAEYSFVSENSKEGNSIFSWYISDNQNGPYSLIENSNSKTLIVQPLFAGKFIKSVIVPVDKTNRAGIAYTTPIVQIEAKSSEPNNSLLENITILNNASLNKLFSSNDTDYVVTVAKDIETLSISAKTVETTSKIDLKFDGSSIVNGEGVIEKEINIPVGNSKLVLSVTSPDSSNIKDYTININRALNSDSNLAKMEITGIDNLPTFNPKEKYYMAKATENQTSINMNLITNVSTSKLKVTANGKLLADYESNEFNQSIPLVAAANTIEIYVKAEDDFSTSHYRLIIFREIASNTNLSSISVDGKALDDFSSDKTDYKLPKADLNKDTLSISVVPEVSSSIVAVTNGTQRVEGTNADIKLNEGTNIITISVLSENLSDYKYYVLTVAKSSDNNADIDTIDFGTIKLSPKFDPSILEYTADAGSLEQSKLTVKAIEPNSTVKITANGQTVSNLAEAQMDIVFDNYKTPVQIEVTSKNGTVKKYTINVNKNIHLLESMNFAGISLDLDKSEFNLNSGYDTSGILTVKASKPDSVIEITSNGQTWSNKYTSQANVVYDSDITVVNVKVTSSKGLEQSYKININRTNSLKDWSFIRENKAGWSSVENNTKAINIKALNGGLYGGQNNAKNILLTTKDLVDRDNFEVTVKMIGKTQSSYDEAGLIIYNGDDDYVAIQRKHNAGSPTINVVTETGGSPDESQNIADIDSEEIYFKLSLQKIDGIQKVICSYSTNGTDWNQLGESNHQALGDNFKVGLIAGSGSADSEAIFTFENFKVNDSVIEFIPTTASVDQSTIIAIRNNSVDTNIYQVPQLLQKSTAILYNGSEKDIDVNWNEITPDMLSEVNTSIILNGTASDTELEPKTIIAVKSSIDGSDELKKATEEAKKVLEKDNSINDIIESIYNLSTAIKNYKGNN